MKLLTESLVSQYDQIAEADMAGAGAIFLIKLPAIKSRLFRLSPAQGVHFHAHRQSEMGIVNLIYHKLIPALRASIRLDKFSQT